MGVIGVDAHVVGNKLMENALRQAGFKVVNLGIFVTQQDFIKAAIETNADGDPCGDLCAVTGNWTARVLGRPASRPAGEISIWLLVETSWWESRISTA